MQFLDAMHWSNWGVLEYTVISLFAVYAIVWVIGKRQNKALGDRIMRNCVGTIFRKHFAEVSAVEEDSSDCYLLNASGRVKVSSAHATLALSPRQDFMSHYVLSNVFPMPDQLVLEITGVESVDPVCICVTRAKLAKAQQDKYPELSKWTKTRTITAFKDKLPLVSLADSLDAADAVSGAGSHLASLSVSSAGLIQCLHYSSTSKNMTVEFAGNLDREDDLGCAIDAALWTAHALASLRLGEKSLKEVRETRSKKDEDIRKAEEEARAEAFARKRSEKIKSMTEEQREKLFEKEQKKKMKGLLTRRN